MAAAPVVLPALGFTGAAGIAAGVGMMSAGATTAGTMGTALLAAGAKKIEFENCMED